MEMKNNVDVNIADYNLNKIIVMGLIYYNDLINEHPLVEFYDTINF